MGLQAADHRRVPVHGLLQSGGRTVTAGTRLRLPGGRAPLGFLSSSNTYEGLVSVANLMGDLLLSGGTQSSNIYTNCLDPK